LSDIEYEKAMIEIVEIININKLKPYIIKASDMLLTNVENNIEKTENMNTDHNIKEIKYKKDIKKNKGNRYAAHF
jgi:hypothetical protein